jgi:diguanylate cyclase (GGDEF)-like protein
MSLNISLARDWQFTTHNLIVQAQDVSARRRAEAELYHNAYHDSLTQLSNRTHFDEQLNRAIARVKRHPDQRFAVMYLDFDRFKMVNDSLGHKAGDELLVHLAKRLKAVLRPTDVLARLGGDEFAILRTQRERDAIDLTERIHRELSALEAGLHGSDVSASIGVTFSSNNYQSSTRSSGTPTRCTRPRARRRRCLRSSLHRRPPQLQLERSCAGPGPGQLTSNTSRSVARRPQADRLRCSSAWAWVTPCRKRRAPLGISTP